LECGELIITPESREVEDLDRDIDKVGNNLRRKLDQFRTEMVRKL
jgi:hypothetical protein